MAYLGNKPVNNFVSFAKQDITGNGGTSYSLDYPVTGANDIELYINNVRQEPTEAYSCSGSTLTLTGAVSSTDDVYVIFRGRALQTAQHPSDSALEASQATISGSMSIGGTATIGGTTNIAGGVTTSGSGSGIFFQDRLDGNKAYGMYAQGGDKMWIYNNQGLGNLVGIDSAGRVTMPYQPAFRATHHSDTKYTGNGTTIVYNTALSNIGSHYNTTTGRFTAPISGMYGFSWSYYTDANVNTMTDLLLNGSSFSLGRTESRTNLGDNTIVASGLVMYYLNANDYVEVKITESSGGVHQLIGGSTNNYNYFNGFLIG